jgi:hypothetical protein
MDWADRPAVAPGDVLHRLKTVLLFQPCHEVFDRGRGVGRVGPVGEEQADGVVCGGGRQGRPHALLVPAPAESPSSCRTDPCWVTTSIDEAMLVAGRDVVPALTRCVHVSAYMIIPGRRGSSRSSSGC